jgi:hypothetical protein
VGCCYTLNAEVKHPVVSAASLFQAATTTTKDRTFKCVAHNEETPAIEDTYYFGLKL